MCCISIRGDCHNVIDDKNKSLTPSTDLCGGEIPLDLRHCLDWSDKKPIRKQTASINTVQLFFETGFTRSPNQTTQTIPLVLQPQFPVRASWQSRQISTQWITREHVTLSYSVTSDPLPWPCPLTSQNSQKTWLTKNLLSFSRFQSSKLKREDFHLPELSRELSAILARLCNVWWTGKLVEQLIWKLLLCVTWQNFSI